MMHAVRSRWCALVLGLAALLAGLPARADTPIAQYQSFRGMVNFTGTVGTLRTAGNSSPCTLATGAIYGKVSGIPSGAVIKSAQLYWAGSGSTIDSSVTFDGNAVTATRQFSSASIGNGFNYFSGAADVTAIVSRKTDPNATYSFSGLTVNNGYPWCGSQGVVGGFALVVVYSHTSEPFRLLNIYEGFQYFQNTGFTINLSGFNVPNPLRSDVTGRIGHITWEGDSTLSQGGENLLFNGQELYDTMNPVGNQFNSASSVTNNASTYGVDFDVYSLAPPYIAAGQTTASTTYRTGQDMVLLSAEVVAMPFVGNADLALGMTRSGDLRVGATTTYTLTVTNNGPDIETGPLTIVDTLPSGLKLVSTSGSGWSCTNAAGSNGTTLVTCTLAGQLAAGSKAAALTLGVTPSTPGTYNNTATVSGRTGDATSSNNTTSNSSQAIDTGSSAVVFTTEACTNGDPIVTAPSDAGCHRFIGPVVAGAATTKIFVTAVSGNRAGAISSYDSSITIGLAASCLPYSNVALTYAQAGLGLDCKGGWKYLTVTVPGGKPSATLPNGSAFFYADVGRITLSLSYMNVTMGTLNFISRPADIRFQSIFRSADGVADLMGATGDGFKKPSPTAFAKAGEQFTMRLGALMADGNFAPSFGKEAVALKDVMSSDLTDLDFELDQFAVNPLATPVLPVSDASGALDGLVQAAFALDQGFAASSAFAGAFDAKARWFEAGYLALTPYLSDYLGTGQVGGPPKAAANTAAARIVDGTRVVGHFYPDRFGTQAAAAFACPAAANCPVASTDPARITFPLNGAVYSTQPFAFTVIPYSLPRDGVEQPLSLFRNLAGSAANANISGGVTYRNVGMSAVLKPNDTTSAALGGFGVDAANPLQTSSGPADFPAMATNGMYTLGSPFVWSTPTSGRSAPVTFYLRASMKEKLVTGPTTTKDIVISSATPASAPAAQYEGGLLVLSGRLLVPNLYGSELLRLPAKLSAQYWNGSTWALSDGDSGSMVADKVTLLGCARSFMGTTAGSCKANAIVPVTAGAVSLVAGAGQLVFQSPGRGAAGSVDFSVSGGNAGGWLPPTRARATFGVYKSPLIYIREAY
jgi:MSHA biogenesis protein MshQ